MPEVSCHYRVVVKSFASGQCGPGTIPGRCRSWSDPNISPKTAYNICRSDRSNKQSNKQFLKWNPVELKTQICHNCPISKVDPFYPGGPNPNQQQWFLFRFSAGGGGGGARDRRWVSQSTIPIEKRTKTEEKAKIVSSVLGGKIYLTLCCASCFA